MAKIQSILGQVALKMSDENGGTLAGICDTDNDHNCFAEKMLKHLKYTKYCPADSEDEFCKTVDLNTRPRIMLEDGIRVRVYASRADCSPVETMSDYLANTHICASFLIDINGLKKPNHGGKDIFGFTMLDKGQILPWGSPRLMVEEKRLESDSCYSASLSDFLGQYCTYCYIYGDCKK